MVPVASVRVPRAPTYSGSRWTALTFRLQGLHLLRLSFQSHSTMFLQYPIAVLLPQLVLVWAVPISLATTFGITGLFSFPPGTKMFQFPGFSPHKLCIGLWVITLFNVTGFPHSDTPGSLSVYDSPRRFAVFCVLLLLYIPRHPPYALFRLITLNYFLASYENC